MAAPGLPPPGLTQAPAALTRATAALSPSHPLNPITDTPSLAMETLQPRQYCGSIRQHFAEAMAAHFEDATDPDRAHLCVRAHPDQRFRGVTKHKRTQRYEAHIWESKKQIYLGGFDSEVLAAKSHDIMALRCKGSGCEILNYAVSDYATLLPLIERLSREDIINALRNYSKLQTATRMGTSPPNSPGLAVSPFAPPGVGTGRVVKHRSSLPSPPSPRLAAQLSAAAARRRRHRRRLAEPLSSSDEEEEEEDGGSGSADAGDYDYLPPSLQLRAPRHQFSLRGSQSVPTPRRRGTGRCPGALPSPRASAAATGGLHPLRSYTTSPAAAMGGIVTLPGRPLGGSGARLRPRPSPHTPRPAQSLLSHEDASVFDAVDLGRMLSHLADEPSLTYSACDESYLFDALPSLDGVASGSSGAVGSGAASGVALEHLAGGALLGPAVAGVPRELLPLVPPHARTGSGGSPDTPQSTLVAATPFAAAPVLPSTVLPEGAPWPGGAWGPRTPLPTQTAQSLTAMSPFAGGWAWGPWG